MFRRGRSSPQGASRIKRLFREEGGILQKAGYRSRHATRSIFSLSKKMKLQKLEFNTSHLHWTSNMWSKVMFIDNLTIRLVRGDQEGQEAFRKNFVY